MFLQVSLYKTLMKWSNTVSDLTLSTGQHLKRMKYLWESKVLLCFPARSRTRFGGSAALCRGLSLRQAYRHYGHEGGVEHRLFYKVPAACQQGTTGT